MESDVDIVNLTRGNIFELCMDSIFFQDKEKANNYLVEKNNSDKYNSFKMFCLKTPFEPYTDMLFDFHFRWLDWTKEIHDIKNNLKRNNREWQNFSRTLTQMLRRLYEAIEKDKDVEVAVWSTLNDKDTIKYKPFTNSFFQFLKKEFSKYNLNETELTFEEAEAEFENGVPKDDDWYENYLLNNNNHVNYKEMIEEYATEHRKKREVTYKLICEKTFVPIIEKAGRKPENNEIGEYALNLSYLIRFVQYMKQNEYPVIFDLPISNETNRLIYDYLFFWDLIEIDRERKDKAPFISSIITQYKKRIGPCRGYQLSEFDVQNTYYFDGLLIRPYHTSISSLYFDDVDYFNRESRLRCMRFGRRIYFNSRY